ncbi:MAG: hypothetical protein WCC14_00240 [Acidobacteriaceae bacterium]
MKIQRAKSSACIARSRREFLRGSVGVLAAASANKAFALSGAASLMPRSEKTIIVTFGGGARDDETFAPDGQRNIPHLLSELLPQGTFFPQIVNKGILGHYVATASIVTGTYERFDNFIAAPPPNPTLFEYFRKGLRRPASDAWVIAPSNGFQRIGSSSSPSFGLEWGAGVILPKRLLSAALPGQGSVETGELLHLLQDNYEMPVYQPQESESDRELHLGMLESTLKLSVKEFVEHARTLNSADELSIYIAQQLMTNQAPSLMLITLHDMDIAHSGAFSLYVDAIQRADRLCAELWTMVQSNPEYRNRTALYILPDFGRDSDGDPAGNGFQHHRTGGVLSRTTWMLAMGSGIREGRIVERAIEPVELVPTIGSRLGFATVPGGRGIGELL